MDLSHRADRLDTEAAHNKAASAHRKAATLASKQGLSQAAHDHTVVAGKHDVYGAVVGGHSIAAGSPGFHGPEPR